MEGMSGSHGDREMWLLSTNRYLEAGRGGGGRWRDHRGQRWKPVDVNCEDRVLNTKI